MNFQTQNTISLTNQILSHKLYFNAYMYFAFKINILLPKKVNFLIAHVSKVRTLSESQVFV